MKVRSAEDAWDAQDKRKGQPHGWVQWKGTNVCMDLHCECGASSHVDGWFAYCVQCPHCNRVYDCNGHIELIELEQKPDSCITAEKG